MIKLKRNYSSNYSNKIKDFNHFSSKNLSKRPDKLYYYSNNSHRLINKSNNSNYFKKPNVIINNINNLLDQTDSETKETKIDRNKTRNRTCQVLSNPKKKKVIYKYDNKIKKYIQINIESNSEDSLSCSNLDSSKSYKDLEDDILDNCHQNSNRIKSVLRSRKLSMHLSKKKNSTSTTPFVNYNNGNAEDENDEIFNNPILRKTFTNNMYPINSEKNILLLTNKDNKSSNNLKSIKGINLRQVKKIKIEYAPISQRNSFNTYKDCKRSLPKINNLYKNVFEVRKDNYNTVNNTNINLSAVKVNADHINFNKLYNENLNTNKPKVSYSNIFFNFNQCQKNEIHSFNTINLFEMIKNGNNVNKKNGNSYIFKQQLNKKSTNTSRDIKKTVQCISNFLRAKYSN